MERYAPWMVRLASRVRRSARPGIGSVVGSDRLQTKGAAQEIKGNIQKAAIDAKDAIQKSVNKVAGAVNRTSDISTFASDGPPRARRPALFVRGGQPNLVPGVNNLAQRCDLPERNGCLPVH
jgi:uncharacterized protein YjbJ (UPF0337 family)